MKNRIRIVNNSPVVLGFTALCVLAFVLNVTTGGISTNLLFCVYRSPLSNPFTYLRLFGHVLGHASVSHLLNNLMLLLVTGPLLEEKYGGKFLIKVMVITALLTGIVQYILFPGSALLGASGIVYAFIVLSSITSYKNGQIPLTLIIVAILYLGTQVYEGVFVEDNVSQLTHIIGGVIGAVTGLMQGAKGNNENY